MAATGSLQLAEIKFDLIDPAGNVQTVSSAGKGNPLEFAGNGGGR